MSDARNLYLIRHGRVDHENRDLIAGARGDQWDPPLGEAGREQARSLARRLASLQEPPSVVYASPLLRCQQTIAPYVELGGPEPILDEDLAEVWVGAWEGRSFEEIVADDEELAARFREAEVLFSLSGGESGEDLRARVRPAIEAIIERHPEGDLAIITHGGVINAYVCPLLAFEHDMLYLPENTSFNTVVIDGADRRVKFLNDVRHLTDPDLFAP